jgi:tight adherence protein B
MVLLVHCSKPWGSLESNVDESYLFAVVGLTVLLGAAYFSATVADRRRRVVRQRLAAAVPSSGLLPDPAVSLRRVAVQNENGRSFAFPARLSARLDAAFAAAGGRIGLMSLVLPALVAPVGVFVLASVVMRLAPAVVFIAAVLGGVGAAFLVLRVAQGRFRAKFLDQFPDALDIIVRAVRAGLPVLEAMTIAAQELPAPVGKELQRALDEMRIGVELEEALQRMADRIRVPDFRFYAVSLALQKRTGGGLANTLMNLSGIIRSRKEMRLKAAALSAEGRASLIVMSIIPFIVGGAMYLINPDFMSSLFFDPRGRFMLGAAFLSLCIGSAMMFLIIRRNLR